MSSWAEPWIASYLEGIEHSWWQECWWSLEVCGLEVCVVAEGSHTMWWRLTCGQNRRSVCNAH